jgi:23S rRNA (guanosine2251-2'-O)-methyltransferase
VAKNFMRIKNMQNKIQIYGKHAVLEALRYKPEVLDKVFLAKENDDIVLREAIENAGITPLTLDYNKKENDDIVHQGVSAEVSADKLMLDYKEFISSLEITEDTNLLILSEIQDPQNVGAIIRSAVAFGVSGILIPQHNQAQISGAVIKVSAGMAFRIPLIHISNVNQTIRDLKKKSFWIYGMEGESEKSIADELFDTPTVFILGNEEKGIREKTKELCDVLLSIPMNKKSESLNVAASTAIVLYEWSTKHTKALT